MTAPNRVSGGPVPAGSPLAHVLQRFDRSMTRIDSVLYGYVEQQPKRTRVGRESPHDDLLRAVLVMLERSFVHAVIQLIALGAPAAVRAGRPGRRLLEWAATDPTAILQIAVSDDSSAGLIQLCERRLQQCTVRTAEDIETLLSELLDCPPLWPVGQRRANGDHQNLSNAVDGLLSRGQAIYQEADLIGGAQSRPLDTKLVRDAFQQAPAALQHLATGLLAWLPELGEPAGRPSPTAVPAVDLVRATRAWARQQGIAVSTRGRPPRELIERYLASQETTSP